MKRVIWPVSVTSAPTRSTAAASAWRECHLVALAGLTWYATGIGWQAQAVSYPLFRSVAATDFAAYHAHYNRAIPGVVIVPGFAAFLAGIAYPWTRPADESRRLAAVVSLSGLVSLLSTVAWAIPMHDRLDRAGQDPATLHSLQTANLVRSLALTTGALALSWSVGRRRAAAPGAVHAPTRSGPPAAPPARTATPAVPGC